MATERRKLPVNRQALYDLRIRKGWSMSELGRQAGVSPSHISAVERGGDIRPDTLKKLADALGEPIEKLLSEPAGRAS
jgi:transcriptional regulator with XRE-family HTH domain